MATVSRELRKALENVVAEAREVAEEAAAKAMQALAVGEAKAHRSMTAAQEASRNRLRAHGRQLGDRRNVEKGTQELDHLVAECAYEHWHRMLFARFLAENQLLIEPVSDVSISIDEVKELARQRGQDWVALAGGFAVRMLPQVFRQGDPILDVQFAPEDRRRLEELLESLPAEVFTADDSLGWTYQFWQAEQKDTINDSGKKIGADELGPVTQLFTEDYMVEFLLHNTLGAWWAAKVLAQKPELATSATTEDELRHACAVGGVNWTYLRFVRQNEKSWRPAAGTFDGWPKVAKEITVLDPCMGSGHFLVFALPIIAALRAADEGLSLKDATLAALRDNLFGLELDARCTQIAAFNLALAVWKVTGHVPVPSLNLACSGVAPNAPEKEWTALAGKDERLRRGMARLHALFKDAPVLGSLINPRSEGDLLLAAFRDLQPLLERALAPEAGDAAHEMAVTARGVAQAAAILAGRFVIVATNVPYLGSGKQEDVLRDYCERVHPDAKADLATCFIDRCLAFSALGGSSLLVTPQNWLFLGTYKKLRQRLLEEAQWIAVARLGEHAFDSTQAAGAFVALLAFTRAEPDGIQAFVGLDAADQSRPETKATHLRKGQLRLVAQMAQKLNPDTRIVLEGGIAGPRLNDFADSFLGLGTGDFPRFGRTFWEFPLSTSEWAFQQASVYATLDYGGRECLVAWDFSIERVRGMDAAEREQIHNQDQSGQQAWGKKGVAVALMRELKVTLYTGERYEKALTVLIPKDPKHLPAIWACCTAPDFNEQVRKLDQKVIVANATVTKIPFDLAHWQRVAAKKYPQGLPKPFSSEPTQWLFNGHPQNSDQPLQVAVARLLGFEWPRQTGSSFPDSPSLGPDGLDVYADTDGVVCLSSLRGEEAAGERLRKLLATAYGKEWSLAKQPELLAQVEFVGESLDDWLRDGFFGQHCALFQQRPFVWHVWDGEEDGFHALVNYHKVAAPDGEGRKTLEKLAYAYLGDWIGRQKAEQKQGKEGADAKLAAALHLQGMLKKILEGEPPHDLFVRWKPLHEQAIGWDPDINDGVRMNIRPFMMAKTLKGKSLFRSAPRIKWDKDRGKETERAKRDFPWFWGWDRESEDFNGGSEFDGNRWNDLHYSISAKKAARDRHEGKGR